MDKTPPRPRSLTSGRVLTRRKNRAREEQCVPGPKPRTAAREAKKVKKRRATQAPKIPSKAVQLARWRAQQAIRRSGEPVPNAEHIKKLLHERGARLVDAKADSIVCYVPTGKRAATKIPKGYVFGFSRRNARQGSLMWVYLRQCRRGCAKAGAHPLICVPSNHLYTVPPRFDCSIPP